MSKPVWMVPLCCLLLGKAEFGAKEQHQYSVHNIVAEAFTHITQSCSDKTFWMSFHKCNVLVINILIIYNCSLR